MVDREVFCEGIENFRDYGGYAVAGGGHLREGLLYRSAHHAAPTAAGLDRLGALGLTVVVDLRGPTEREKGPSLRPEGFAARVYAPDAETSQVAPHLEAAVKTLTLATDAEDAMAAVYAAIPCRPDMLIAYRQYLEALESAEGPVLIHCTAGKDRTGIAVALFHHLAGVHHDDIIADYMLTNVVGDAERRTAEGIALIRRNFALTVDDDTIRSLVTVEPRYIDAAFDAIRTDYGSLESYVDAALGFDRERCARLVAQYVG